MNSDEARELLDKWKRGWVVMNDLSTQIMKEEIWLSLGYESFTQMFEGEGLNDMVLSAPARRSAIRAVMEESPGISNRRVAEILGVGSRTVDRDVDTASRDAPILPKNVQLPKINQKSSPSQPKPSISQPVKVIEGIVSSKVHDCPGCQCESK